MARTKQNADDGTQNEQTTETPAVDETSPAAQTPENQAAAGAPAQNEDTADACRKRVRHAGLKGKKLVVLTKTVQFDADGVCELDAADAEYLLTIPGYEAAE
jgi:hypothetical protein